MRWVGFVVPFVLLLLSCDRSLPTENVCFSEHIVPIVREDCATCHTNGEYAVRLEGSTDDYENLKLYIIGMSAKNSPLLLWPGGLNEHPSIWVKGSKEHATVAAWIREGSSSDCGTPSDGDADADADADVDGDSDADGDSGDDADDGSSVISFSEDIVPVHYRDCRPCHLEGMHPPVIDGDVDDYPVVMRYVNIADPEAVGGWLWWSAGGNLHPVSWPVVEPEYQLFLEWVLQGAENN